MKLLLMILSFATTAILFGSYILNYIYVEGANLLDTGWFTHLISNSLSLPIQNPPVLEATRFGDTFFTTHISPIFYIMSKIYHSLLSPLPPQLYYAIFVGSMFGIISLSVYIAGVSLKSEKNLKYLLFIFLIALITPLNGASLSLISFPHIEIAIPAFILLFLSLYLNGYRKSSYLILFLLLTVREDAGLHFALLILSILLLQAISHGFKKIDRELLILATVAILYSLIVMFIQKHYFNNGDDALLRVYLGNPPFHHISIEFIQHRLEFFLRERVFIWLPMLSMIILSIIFRNIFFVAPILATLPWLAISLIAITPMPGHLNGYYEFPFIIALSWPIFAFLLYKRYILIHYTYSFKKVTISIISITLLSTLTYPSSKDLIDNTPWKKFIFTEFDRIAPLDKFSKEFSRYRDRFGNTLFDESISVFMTTIMSIEEYGYLNRFTKKQIDRADTVIFIDRDRNHSSREIMYKIISKNGLNHICKIENSDFVLASKESIDIFKDVCKPYRLNLTRFEIERNQKILFNDKRVLWEHWYGAERSHRWSFGRYSSILFYINSNNIEGKLLLNIHTLGEQTVTIRLNNIEIFHKRVKGSRRLSITFNPDILKSNKLNIIELLPSNPHRPNSRDKRELAIALKYFIIY